MQHGDSHSHANVSPSNQVYFLQFTFSCCYLDCFNQGGARVLHTYKIHWVLFRTLEHTERVYRAPTFSAYSNCDTDHFGREIIQRGRVKSKKWIVISLCTVSRSWMSSRWWITVRNSQIHLSHVCVWIHTILLIKRCSIKYFLHVMWSWIGTVVDSISQKRLLCNCRVCLALGIELDD